MGVSGVRWKVTMQIAFLQQLTEKQQFVSQFASPVPIRCHGMKKI